MLSIFAKRRLSTVIPTIIALAGLWIFSTGFLIVRKTVDVKSKDPPVAGDNWLKSPFKKPPKIVILLIDALRIDMVVPDLNSDKPPLYRNRLNVLWEIAKKSPEHAKLFRFIADPPTATTQRLQGLLAGTLPTFVEVGDSFSDTAMQMDSWIWQALHSPASPYRNVHFYGDDTWTNLCPFMAKQTRGGRVEGYLSFHLFDLHTVDTAVKKAIFPVLESRQYDLLIAHFLGHDHCGHKHGPSHEDCGLKLQEMDEVVRKTIGLMDRDDILLVMGDHGMTDDGDHGGVSPKEVSSVLFAYSPGHRLPLVDNDLMAKVQSKRDADLSANDLQFFPLSDYIPSLNQIDLVPTLSVLMGLPIPFSNLGTVAADLLFDANLTFALQAIRMNAHQVRRYLQHIKFDGISQSIIDRLYEIDGVTGDSQKYQLYADWLSDVLRVCKQQWATFNNNRMNVGLVLSMAAVVNMLIDTSRSWLSLTAISVSILHSVLMTTTSFVVFEDDIVRFLLSTILFITKPLQPSSLFTAMLTVRLLKYVGGCREEQFPHCQTINHRNIPLLSFILLFILSAVNAVRLYRHTVKTRLQVILLLTWWLGWWMSDTLMATGIESAWSEYVSTWTPRVIWMLSEWRRESALLSLAVLQRPVNGLVLINAAPIFFDAIQDSNNDILYSLFGQALFYATGHQTTLSSLQWETAFVGCKQVFPPIQAALMLFNTMAGPIAACLYRPFVVQKHRNQSTLFHTHPLLVSIGAAVACKQLLRHLMIWKIFAPRLLFSLLFSVCHSLVSMFTNN